MQDQLQKAINLSKKTGDRLIVFDSAKPDNVFVVMSVKDYENLIIGKSEVRGLTEDELLDKINRDIAIWKSEQDFVESSQKEMDYFKELPELEEEPVEMESSGSVMEKISKKNNKGWTIPLKRKSQAEEIIEEDRQYLEELAF